MVISNKIVSDLRIFESKFVYPVSADDSKFSLKYKKFVIGVLKASDMF